MPKETRNRKIEVLEKTSTVVAVDDQDYISLTDMLKAKDGDFFIADWLRNRNTIEFLGIWESVHNPNFNYGEFATIKSKAGLNSYKLTAKQWRKNNPNDTGNIRDYANGAQLVCLANMENLNAVFIHEGLPQHERLARLNQIAISQMTILTKDRTLKDLTGTSKP